MKLLAIARFELGYQARRPWTWLIVAALVVFAFLFTRDGSLSAVLRDDFFLNSPFLIAGATVFGCVIWLLIGAAVAGDAAARDVATGMAPLSYTAPVSKTEYLGGRFCAAFVLNALILLAVPAGNLLGLYLPGVHPDAVGPFRLAAYVTAYAFIALPNAFVATALQFAFAAPSGRPMAAYAGSLLLVFLAFFVASFLLFRSSLGTLIDPIGMRFVVEDLSRLWTPIEKATRLIELNGDVRTNRLLWVGVGVAALALTYPRFRFAHRLERRWLRPRIHRWPGRAGGQRPGHDAPSAIPAGIGVTPSAQRSVPQVPRAFGAALHARQTLAIAWTSFRAIATSRVGLALVAGVPLLTIPVVIDQMVSSGVPLVPTTALVIAELTAPLSAELSRWVIVPLLLVFFAGELVWRERDAGLAELTDAMPGSEWLPLLGKYLGLGFVLLLFTANQTAAAMLAQAILGYRDFEVALYLKVMFGLQLLEYLLFALLALLAHVLANQKYLGHLAAIIAYAFIALAPMFGVEHDLLVYGSGPGWSYTETRGFGPSLEPWLWFRGYWAAWALLLAVIARLFWVRGRERGLGVRLQLARRRCTRATVGAGAIGMGLVLALGGFIFYNANVLNAYRTESNIVEQAAEYERRYGQYAGIPQPRLTAATLRVEIHPERRAVDIRGTYRLVNRSATAIGSVHVAASPDVDTRDVTFDRPAARVLIDEALDHRIYTLERPLQPGDSLRLDFALRVAPRGFRESGVDPSVTANGTYFTNGWLPAIGYQRSRELTSASDRRAQGLAARPLIPSLDDIEAPTERSEGIDLEVVAGTREDQVAVAPGALRRTWTENGRRYFHYATDGPIGDEWAFFSANYAVRDARWNDVAIRIFHDPRHTRNLGRMIRSIQASLDYYTAQFGPYPRAWLNVVERPGNGTGMHAEAGMLTFTEGTALWDPTDEGEGLDLPYAVTAHEMAHQWTVPYARVEGAPVMSESVAWYYALKLVEHTRGPEQLRRLLRFMRQPHPYPPIRRGEPLLRGLDPYLAYRRGPFALYALSEYIGAPQVNGALRRLLDAHRRPEAPLATTRDLYRELQAATPDSLQYLLHDLFEVNTYWELEAEGATARQTEAGAWQVTLAVRARKVVVDAAGVEAEAPMNDLVEVGLFDDNDPNEPVYLQTHRLGAGRQTLTVTTARKPAHAGIDPRHLLIDSQPDDNVRALTVQN